MSVAGVSRLLEIASAGSDGGSASNLLSAIPTNRCSIKKWSLSRSERALPITTRTRQLFTAGKSWTASAYT